MLKKKTKQEKILFWAAVIMTAAACSISLMSILGVDPHLCPDEIMRYDVAEWIFKNNRLPWGNEPELISAWGFNYSLAPYLPTIVSVLFMKITALFTENKWALFAAFRMPSLLSHLCIGIFAYLTARRLFKGSGSKICFLAFSLFWPQIFYLATYLNNDIFALALCYGIFFCWVYGLQEGWDWKAVVGFGVILGMLTITYYYAYGWILCSIIFFCFTMWKQKKSVSEFWIKTGSVTGVAFIVGGWFFIKNALFMPWDFLGFQATDVYRTMYAIDTVKNIPIPYEYQSLGQMIFGANPVPWWITTLRSYIASYQLYTVVPSTKQYLALIVFLVPSFFAGLVKAWQSFCSRNSQKKMLVVCEVLAFGIPIFLTIFSSYYIDYQPQGRYFISSLPVLVLWISFGWQKISTWINALLQKFGFQKHLPIAACMGIGFALLGTYIYLRLNWAVLFKMLPYFGQYYIRPF